jgi:hypothetical protein
MVDTRSSCTFSTKPSYQAGTLEQKSQCSNIRSPHLTNPLACLGFEVSRSLPFTKASRFFLVDGLHSARCFSHLIWLRDSTNHEILSRVLDLPSGEDLLLRLRRFGGVVNAMPCYLSYEDIERHFLREQEFESLRRRIFCFLGAC